MIRKISRKIVPSLFVASLLIVVGSFCEGFMASAAPALEKMPVMENVHCGKEDGMISNEKNGETSGGIMPCCIGTHHDNSEILLPDITNGKTNFSDAINPAPTISAFDCLSQTTCLTSKSPPPKPDILSSVLRLE